MAEDFPKKRAIVLFLGAGFSKPWGLPLTSELLPDSQEKWERIIEERFPRKYQKMRTRRVQASWLKYHNECQGTVDQFAKKLQADIQGAMGLPFDDLTYFLAVRLAVEQSEMRIFNMQPQFTKHHIGMQKVILPCYDVVMRVLEGSSLKGIVTTNYDLVVEKILGPDATGRLGGFHYGKQGQPLHRHHHQFTTKDWYHRETIDGMIPLLKIHGSLNWAFSKEQDLEVYVDCYPSLTRGHQPLIVPPQSTIQQYHIFKQTWQKASEVLQDADVWIFCGYSFPDYDSDVKGLLKSSAHNLRRVVVLHHDEIIEKKIRGILNAVIPEIEVKRGPLLGDEQLTESLLRSLISGH